MRKMRRKDCGALLVVLAMVQVWGWSYVCGVCLPPDWFEHWYGKPLVCSFWIGWLVMVGGMLMAFAEGE